MVGKIGGVATVFAHPFILSTPAEAAGLCASYSRFRAEAGWDQPGRWRSTQRTTSTIPAIAKPTPSASRRALPCRVLESPASEVPEEGGIKRPDRYC